MLRACPIAAALVLTVAGTANADQAQDKDSADALIREAAAAGRAGDQAVALDKFKQAQALYPRASNACNIGLVYARLARWPQAQLFLAQCREGWSRQEARSLPRWVDERMHQVMSELRAGAYAAVEIEVTPADALVRIDAFADDEAFRGARVVWLPHGTHRISAEAAGHRPTSRRVVLTPSGDSTRVALSLASESETEPNPAPERGPRAEPEPAAELEPAAAPEIEPEPPAHPALHAEPSPSRWRRPVGWSGLGVGAAALAGGALFYARAASTADDADRQFAAGSPELERAQRDFETERNWAYGLLGVGAAAAGAGLWLLLSDDSGAERTTYGATIHRDGAGAWVRFSL